jgi:hypothetical protein
MTEACVTCNPKSFINEIDYSFSVNTFVADNTRIHPTLSVRE